MAVAIAFVLIASPAAVFADGAAEASSAYELVYTPAAVGMSSERLARIDNLLEQSVDTGQLPGVTAMIGRRGKVVYLKAFGKADIEADRNMATDSLYQIASMSKSITAVAVMTLYEEGRFLLADPLSKYIPEFAEMEVLVPEGDSYSLVPANGPITIRHLLNNTSGITYRFFGHPHFTDIYGNAGISDGLDRSEGQIGEMVKKLAGLPLRNHPGEAWEYGLSSDVLGYLVEVLSGIPFDQFLQERVFEPLGMKDTHFYLPEEKAARLVSLYSPNQEGGFTAYAHGTLELGPLVINPGHPITDDDRSYFSGGAGLVSAAPDFGRLCQMLLNGGELEGVRILSPSTVEVMTTNQIGDLFSLWPQNGEKWGLGFAVRTNRGPFDELESIGTFGWAGLYNTFFWVNPAEERFGVMMTQLLPGPAEYLSKFSVLAHQSIID